MWKFISKKHRWHIFIHWDETSFEYKYTSVLIVYVLHVIIKELLNTKVYYGKRKEQDLKYRKRNEHGYFMGM